MPPSLLRNHRSNGAASPFLRIRIGALLGVLLASTLGSPVLAQSSTGSVDLALPKIELLGEYRLPSGLKLDGVEFGGISALEFDEAAGAFWALSDDRAQYGPARVYVLRLDIGDRSGAGVVGVDIVDAIELLSASGQPYPAKSLDPEALRRAPDGGFYWAHERDERGVPHVGEMDAEAKATRSYALPDYYIPSLGSGVRVNLAFESLTIEGEGKVVVATENALAQDGPAASVEVGSRSRVLIFDPETGEPVAEYAYDVDPVAARPYPATGFKTNGLVELLYRPEGGFFALERSFSVGVGNVVKLYATDFHGASDVLGSPSLQGLDVAPMRKRLVLTLQAGTLLDAVDNLEAMSFGPMIDGKRTLVLMSDNNFNPNGQFTQILVFTIE